MSNTKCPDFQLYGSESSNKTPTVYPEVVEPDCPCIIPPSTLDNNDYSMFKCAAGYTCSSQLSSLNDLNESRELLPSNIAAMKATCKACSLGQHCPTGTVTPHDCPEGYYCPNPSSIYPCPEGHYCPRRTTGAYPCDTRQLISSTVYIQEAQLVIDTIVKGRMPILGNYCPLSALTPVTPCPPGSYCPNASVIIPCPERHFCREGSAYPRR